MPTLQSLREAAADTWWTLTAWAGHPHEVARHGFASRRIYRLMLDWIGNLERLVRRIVYLAALTLDVPALAPVSARKSRTRLQPLIPGRPPGLRLLKKWRAPKRGSRRRRRHDDDPDHQWQPVRIGHLARRMEALRHAIYHTRPHALRLARLLARRAATGRTLPQVGFWLIPSHKLTSGQGQVDESMMAIAPMIDAELRKRGALIEDWDEEPG